MQKFYITAAIPYVNAPPHIGHALEFVQGDVLARYHRANNDQVYYVTGADENSLKNVVAAQSAGVPVQELCDSNARAFVCLLESYNVQIDNFQRSSTPKHIASAQDLWKKCADAGDIYKKKYKGLYCVGCEAFYVESELNQDQECFEHPGKPLDVVEEENYFFRLSKYQDALLDIIKTNQYKILPETKKNEALGFINQGLQDFSISRSAKRAKGWGVPVPGDESQYMYVWFDALNVYRSGAPDYWPADLHLIGKGILRFHAIYWPAILLSANEPLPKELFVHGYITLNGQKMSKSLGNTIDPIALIEKYGADPVRYYLLREVPTSGDGDFSEEKFIERYNGDLANGLGNFTSRVLTLANELGEFAFSSTLNEEELVSALRAGQDKVSELIKQRRLHDALAEVWKVITAGDLFINQAKPWEVEDEEQKQIVLGNLINLLSAVAELLAPFLPQTSEKILSKIKITDSTIKATNLRTNLFPRL